MGNCDSSPAFYYYPAKFYFTALCSTVFRGIAPRSTPRKRLADFSMERAGSKVTQRNAWVTFWVTFLRGYEPILKVTQQIREEKEKKYSFLSFSTLWVTFKTSSYPRKKVTQKVTQAVWRVTSDSGTCIPISKIRHVDLKLEKVKTLKDQNLKRLKP